MVDKELKLHDLSNCKLGFQRSKYLKFFQGSKHQSAQVSLGTVDVVLAFCMQILRAVNSSKSG